MLLCLASHGLGAAGGCELLNQRTDRPQLTALKAPLPDVRQADRSPVAFALCHSVVAGVFTGSSPSSLASSGAATRKRTDPARVLDTIAPVSTSFASSSIGYGITAAAPLGIPVWGRPSDGALSFSCLSQ